MKATVTVNQEELELKAIDSMIAYEKASSPIQKWRRRLVMRCGIMEAGKDTGKSF